MNSMFRQYPKLFQDPAIDYPIYDFKLSFTDYIQQSSTLIRQTRQDLATNADTIIAANAPFALQPATKAKYGALLIHGLLDCPFMLRDIGKNLQAQGYLVHAILLPGHGTVPGALLNTDYTAWLQAVRYGIESLKSEVEKIFLVGFSTGGTLALHPASADPAIMGLITLAPALKINSPFDFATHWYRVFCQAWPRANWMYIGQEKDYVRYTSVAFNAPYQLYRLIRSMPRSISPYPIFMAASYEDALVSTPVSLNYFQQNTGTHSRALIYTKQKLSFADARILMRNSSYPEFNIVNFGHISLPIAPTNAHYGPEGDYPFATKLAQQTNILYGEQDKVDTLRYYLAYRLKLTNMRHRRLTFNPDFAFLCNEINKFIYSVTAMLPQTE